MELKTHTLPSGAELKINVAPHAESKAVFKACMAEFEKVGLKTGEMGVETFVLNLAGLIFSSDRIEDAVKPCLKRCLYGDEKITEDTFEPEERRVDYMPVMIKVVEENIAPFLKGLFSEFQGYRGVMEKIGYQPSFGAKG